MIRIILFIAIFIFSVTDKINACDCDYNGSFVTMAGKTPLVVLIKVTKYMTFADNDSTKIPLSMQVEVIKVYKGKESHKLITIWGGDGYMCRPYLGEFGPGEYYLMALYFGHSRYDKGIPIDYAISNCGEYWLNVNYSKSIAEGDIEGDQRNKSSMKLSELKRKIKAL